jgi:hypothetical protein
VVAKAEAVPESFSVGVILLHYPNCLPPKCRLDVTWPFCWERIMMTSQEAATRLLAEIGADWPRCKPIPTEPIVTLCEAVWREGGRPTITRLASRLGLSVRAVRLGVMAWHRRVDTSIFDLQTPASQQQNLDYLIRNVSPAIATAPRTYLDPLYPGRWSGPSGKILAYLARIRDRWLRDTLTLFSLIEADSTDTALYGCITGFASGMRRLMLEASIPVITAVDPYDLFARLYRREIGRGFTDHYRVRTLKLWNQVSRAFLEYARKLSAEDANRMRRSSFALSLIDSDSDNGPS